MRNGRIGRNGTIEIERHLTPLLGGVGGGFLLGGVGVGLPHAGTLLKSRKDYNDYSKLWG